jgi:6-phosphogluconolactonase
VAAATEVFASATYAAEAAARIAVALPGSGSVVLTGGTTAARVYEHLAEADVGWGELDVFFSDERCVPPDDDRSNYGLARLLLLQRATPGSVHRMRGELDPEAAARAYDRAIEPAVRSGIDLELLGMGSDCHVAALFPGSPALGVESPLCLAVERPDGLGGLTLTPPALLAARRVLVIVAGGSKAEAVRRAVAGGEPPEECPARLLAAHPDVTFLVDEEAAREL